jgi:class 3 adenylate cyclase
VRRLPIHDAVHVRNALARFDQVAFEDDAARERARERVLRAAKRHGIVPLGFFDVQLRREREARATGDRRRWPRGSVTFLMTDIERSTALIDRLGDAYAHVLRDVRSVIRDSVRRAKGHEIDSRGDEFFAAFEDPAWAAAAAVDIQRRLSERSWPRGAKVCVRIGIHTGRSTLNESGYVGIAVHTAARICAAGHGGQIVASGVTVSALGERSNGMRMRDLGQFVLPGIKDPLALFQVHALGLRRSFPALRTSERG